MYCEIGHFSGTFRLEATAIVKWTVEPHKNLVTKLSFEKSCHYSRRLVAFFSVFSFRTLFSGIVKNFTFSAYLDQLHWTLEKWICKAFVQITFIWKKLSFFTEIAIFSILSNKIRRQWYCKIFKYFRKKKILFLWIFISYENSFLKENSFLTKEKENSYEKENSFLTVVAIFSISFKIISFNKRLYYYCKMMLLQTYLAYRQIYGPFKRQDSKRNGQITFFEK